MTAPHVGRPASHHPLTTAKTLRITRAGARLQLVCTTSGTNRKVGK
jgi:hypothetical protein